MEENKEALVKRESFQIIPIIPKDYEEVFSMAGQLADSGMVPKQYAGKKAAIIVAIQMGLELGLLPIQSIQNIAVINGMPSVWGDAMLALVMGSGHLESINEFNNITSHSDKKDYSDSEGATCEVKRFGKPHKVIQAFNVGDAKIAQLWNKVGPWQTAPKRMLQMRARGFALRDLFPDVLKGIISREEAQDYIDVEAMTTIETEKEEEKKKLDASKKVLDDQKPDLELLKDGAKSSSDDIPVDIVPPETKKDLISTDQFTVFLDKAKELKLPIKKLVEFAKKNGFDDASQITTDKYDGMLEGLEHLTK